MSKINDGGAAFPVIPPQDELGIGSASGYPFPEQGMTLRDYIASHALSAIIEADGIQFATRVREHAQLAYAQADAMIKAREVTNA